MRLTISWHVQVDLDRLQLQTISWRSSQNARLYVFDITTRTRKTFLSSPNPHARSSQNARFYVFDINTRKTFLSSPSPQARSYRLFCVQSLYDWPKNIYSIILTRPSKYMKFISLVCHDLYISLIGGLQRRVIGILICSDFP